MSQPTAHRWLRLTSGLELPYLSEAEVNSNLETRGWSRSDELSGTQHSDLISGVYEGGVTRLENSFQNPISGGLKLWECAVDLCNYIDANAIELQLSGKRVLEVRRPAWECTAWPLKLQHRYAITARLRCGTSCHRSSAARCCPCDTSGLCELVLSRARIRTTFRTRACSNASRRATSA